MTFWAIMYSDTQVFRHICTTFGAKLTATFGINFLMVSPSLSTYPIQDAEELSWRTIENVLGKHSSAQSQDLQVFSKYHSCLTAKMVTDFILTESFALLEYLFIANLRGIERREANPLGLLLGLRCPCIPRHIAARSLAS